ncbi:MAG TPA: VWA domain-containing protein [Longimicrobiales bacterium]
MGGCASLEDELSHPSSIPGHYHIHGARHEDHDPAGPRTRTRRRIVRLLLKLEAAAPQRGERLPLNLSLVLDRPGSMHGDKLRAACAAAALLVRRLSPEDVVSVVAYDDQVVTVAAPAKGAEQALLPREIERIETGGSTNLSGGWLRGRELDRAYNTSTGRRKKDELIRRKRKDEAP